MRNGCIILVPFIVARSVSFEMHFRSLTGFPLQPKMSEDDYDSMEKEMKKYFDAMEGDYSGNYYSIRDMPIKVRV